VILDEAQNTTSEQMKMFLTRLGFNSKAVITGDVTQIDLPLGKKSGLVEAMEICGKIPGISVVQFGEKDVVRHNLVQQIIRAYEEFDASHPQRGGANNKSSSAQRESARTEQSVPATSTASSTETPQAPSSKVSSHTAPSLEE
jgi:phosphate starvation-inducible protein PhoH and related proteins